jgi:hypothetical protein
MRLTTFPSHPANNLRIRIVRTLPGIEPWSELGPTAARSLAVVGDHFPPEVATHVAIINPRAQGKLLQGTLPLLILRTLAAASTVAHLTAPKTAPAAAGSSHRLQRR